MKTRDIVIIAGLGALAVWFVSKKLGAAGQAVLNAPAALGSKIGISLYDWIHPNTVGESVFYVVTFPGGARHAVASGDVAAGGGFMFQGVPYYLKADASGNKFAVEA
jgi:hypothetical protein